jgi:hypothetical protein
VLWGLRPEFWLQGQETIIHPVCDSCCELFLARFESLPRSLRRPASEAGFRVSGITLASRGNHDAIPCLLESPLSRAD